MANITISIPDAQLTRVVDAFAIKFNWDGSISKPLFAKQKLMEMIIKTVYETETNAAVVTAMNSINQNLTIT
jgi:hypothetical protein